MGLDGRGLNPDDGPLGRSERVSPTPGMVVRPAAGTLRTMPGRSPTASGAAARPPAPAIPGMDVALACPPARAAGGPAFADVRRTDRNAWALVAGCARADADATLVPRRVLDVAEAWPRPAQALAAAASSLRASLSGGPVDVVLARVELDRCGAWVTVACAGSSLPVVVRRAGWIDVRGQAGPALGSTATGRFGEDRVGLGPGDAVVVCTTDVRAARDAAGERFADEGLPTALLRGVGASATELADVIGAAAVRHASGVVGGGAAVLAVVVPPQAETDPDARLEAALGDDADRALPGYPVGEPAWSPHERPAPPREARIALRSTVASVPEARRFLEGLLRSWRMDEVLDGDVELITTELVTNAVRHAGSLTTVLVTYDGARVRVAVGDGSRALPQGRSAQDDDLGGRGLHIVDVLATAWGTTPTVEGKRVWAEVDVPPRR